MGDKKDQRACWLITCVATFIPQSFFKGPYVVSVPTEEVPGTMNAQRLIDVHGDEVVVSGLCARVKSLVESRRLLH